MLLGAYNLYLHMLSVYKVHICICPQFILLSAHSVNIFTVYWPGENLCEECGDDGFLLAILKAFILRPLSGLVTLHFLVWYGVLL
jgi:hypothetical protein